MVSIHPIDEGYCIPDVGISTSHQRGKRSRWHPIDEGIAYLTDVGISTSRQREKWSHWGLVNIHAFNKGVAYLMSAYPRRASERNEAGRGRLAFIQLTRGIAYLMSAYPRRASERNEASSWLRTVNIHPIDEGLAYLMSAYPRRASERNEAGWGRLTFIQSTKELHTWCRHIHVAPAREFRNEAGWMVSIHPIDEGHCVPDVGISTSRQQENLETKLVEWLAFIQLTRGIAYLMSAYPRRASERNETGWGRLTFIQSTKEFHTWCRHIHVAPARETKLVEWLAFIQLTRHIAYPMSAYPRRASKRNEAGWGQLTFIQSTKELRTWCRHIHVVPAREIVAKKAATVIDEAIGDVHQGDLVFLLICVPGVRPPSCIPPLWCRSPIGRYFCTAEITCQKKGIFLIPLTKRFLFTVGTKLLEG